MHRLFYDVRSRTIALTCACPVSVNCQDTWPQDSCDLLGGVGRRELDHVWDNFERPKWWEGFSWLSEVIMAVDADRMVPFRFLIGPHIVKLFISMSGALSACMIRICFFFAQPELFNDITVWLFSKAKMIEQEQSTGRWSLVMRNLAAFLLSLQLLKQTIIQTDYLHACMRIKLLLAVRGLNGRWRWPDGSIHLTRLNIMKF